MFFKVRYQNKIIPSNDIFYGIITWLYFILTIQMIVSLAETETTTFIKGCVYSIIVLEQIMFWANIIFTIVYDGTFIDYEKIKTKIWLAQCLLSSPLVVFSIFVMFHDIDSDAYALCNILVYIVLSFVRFFNFASYAMDI
jgi:hypothetical protein